MSKGYQAFYIIVATAISAAFAFEPNFNINIIVRLILFIAGIIGGYVGFRIGEAIRNFAQPDYYSAPNATSLFYKKIWWACGLQLFGTFLGSGAGVTLFGILFGIDKAIAM